MSYFVNAHYMRLICLFSIYAVIFSLLLPVHAQVISVSGKVESETTHLPISYVNIGIKNKNVGTAANQYGNFFLNIPEGMLNDTLTFSAIGYEEEIFPIGALVAAQLHTFQLTEKITKLQEVIVKGKLKKTRRIGTTTHNPLLWGNVFVENVHDVVEFAKFIPLGSKPSQLIQAHILLRKSKLDSVSFRINFYGVAQNLPSNRIVEQSIIVRLPSKNGWLAIDLTKYALTLQTDFYIGFEFLPEVISPVPSFNYGAQFGGYAVTRTSSLGTWQRESGARLSAYVTVIQ